jgi:exosome complex RNA-binding protein Rrp42 (RNase PH superfamily)
MKVGPDLVQIIDPLAFQLKFINEGVRADGRTGFESIRSIKLVPNVISSCQGSASCSVGNTSVVVGITAGVVSLPDGIVKPDHMGRINVTSDMSVCYSERQLGQVKGAVLADRIGCVLEEIVPTKQLEVTILKESKIVFDSQEDIVQHVWDLNINLVVVNDDGSVFDAALMATVAALKQVTLPALDKNLRIVAAEEGRLIKIVHEPSPLTICSVRDKLLLVDPTKDEEQVFPRYTMAVSSEGYLLYMVGPDFPDGVKVERVEYPQLIDRFYTLAKDQARFRIAHMNSNHE